ncbi:MULTISPECIES: DUF2378 family protein [Corallococcus]|uniref:DUF2378 family protein n=1 Tax=Corallococcus TaxID=83461 RepID=UPI001F41675C|nr:MULTISPECIES: DUF2378 family protein [Corallococcus]
MGVIKGLEHTLLGKALVSLWPIFGPDIKVSECNGNPGYHLGIIEAGLTRAGAKNLRVEPFDFNGHACSYRVRWDQ